MQTTLTVAAVDGDVIAVAHIGDCRLYRLRNGFVELMTRDHTVANDPVELRLYASEHAPQSQLTRAVGHSLFPRVAVMHDRILPRDTFLLCSDGLWSRVDDDTIKHVMLNNDTYKVCAGLSEIARAAGSRDDITLIAFRLRNPGKKAKPAFTRFWRGVPAG